MEYRRLGRSGLKVSEICLGTMTFGNGADQAGASRMVDAALAAGVNFFDTANSYVGGTSETMLGEALSGKRERSIEDREAERHQEEDREQDGGSRRRGGHPQRLGRQRVPEPAMPTLALR